jgi:SAM-dependent methyltransferase
MKNIDEWRPSKFVYVNGKLRASRDKNEVGISSRFVADLVASHYDEHLKHHAKGRLIDLGCGKVPLYQSYKDYITESICADWQDTIHSNRFLDVVCDLNKPLPFEANAFDTIILSDVLEHLSNPTSLWSEMNRILKKGGKIILNVPFFYKLHETPHDYFRYTKFALTNFANNVGLSIVILKEIGGLPEIFTDLSSKLIYNVPFIGRYCAVGIQTIGAITAGKRLSKKTMEHFPLGYFMIVEKN